MMSENSKELAKSVLVCLLNSTFSADRRDELNRLLQEVADVYDIDFDCERDRRESDKFVIKEFIGKAIINLNGVKRLTIKKVEE